MTIKQPVFKALALFFVLLFVHSCKEEKQQITTNLDTECAIDSDSYFLFLADIHLNTFNKETPKGHDTGMLLWKAAKTKIETVLRQDPPPKFVIYTGDLPDHNPQEGEKHNANIAKILSDLKQLVGNTPLFYAPGNNDALDGDYYTFTNKNGRTPFSLTPNLNYPAPNATLTSNPHPEYGYYSARPFPGLRIIAMNSIILGNKYYEKSHDTSYSVSPIEKLNRSNTLMQWVGSELQAAEKQNEKAYIIMHIPPGNDAYSNDKMWESDSLLSVFRGYTKTYKNTISGIFYGHTHMDELRRIYDNDGQIQEIAISAPGISPNHGQNPGFKLVSYNTDSFEPSDFITYYTKRSDTIWSNNCYSFSDSYVSEGINIKTFLSTKPLDSVLIGMQHTYMVKNGKAGYDIELGIEVK